MNIRRVVKNVQTQDWTPCTTTSDAPRLQVCLVQATRTVTSLAAPINELLE